MKSSKRGFAGWYRKARYVLRVAVVSAVTSLVIVGLTLGVLWHYKGQILQRLATSVANQRVAANTIDGISLPVVGTNSTVFTGSPQPSVAPAKTSPQIIVQKIPAVTDVVAKANKSVVSIAITQADGTLVAKGTGFFVSTDGLIVTNRHVVDFLGDTITVTTAAGITYPATTIALDSVLDIGVIKIDGVATKFPVLSLGNSDMLLPGQSVIAIGFALGQFQNSVSVGVVSGLSRSVVATGNSGEAEFLDQVIQTDAAINPGNSGGPLLNLAGQVIGVNVAMASASQSIGFALPINDVRQAIESVEATGAIVRPYIGVRYEQITPDVQKALSLSSDYGVLVDPGTNATGNAVVPNSPADKAGIVNGDIILSIDGIKLTSDTSLAAIVRQKKIGQIISLVVLHGGAQRTISVALEKATN